MAQVLVPLAEGFEEIEAVAIVDILRRAEIDVISAGLADGPVTGSRGIVVVPDTTIAQVQDDPFEMIVLPGGLPGTTHLQGDSRIINMIRRVHDQGGYVTAICAAPSIFAGMGLLKGRQVTSHPSVKTADGFAEAEYIEQRVVVDGHFITSRGPGTAIEFAMQLVETLAGPAKVEQLNQGMLARL